MAKGNTYTRSYSDFIGVDLSSDPKSVSPNRLAYSVNMWRDYESEQGAAIETFPGFRRVAEGLGKIHGIYNFRDKNGENNVIVHAGRSLFAFSVDFLLNGWKDNDNSLYKMKEPIWTDLSDNDSTGFIFNNNLYVLDGHRLIEINELNVKNESQGLKYCINADGISYSVASIGECMDVDIVIPSRYEGLPVTGIKEKAFMNQQIVSVKLPSSIISIGQAAFSGCYLMRNVDIPDSVRVIKEDAFAGCINISSAKIPSSVSSIGAGAFRGCQNLCYIEYRSDSNIPDACFADCNGWAVYNFSYIGNKPSIGENAITTINNGLRIFASSSQIDEWKNDSSWGGLESFLFSLPYSTWVSTGPTDVNPEYAELNFIGPDDMGFSYRLHLDEASWELIAGESCDATDLQIPSAYNDLPVVSITPCAFMGNTYIKTVVIPPGVKSIGNSAFRNCTNLTRVVIGSDVETIGAEAFAGCPCLEEVVFNGNYKLKKIGVKAFENCLNLRNIELPETVDVIGYNAFYDCALNHIKIPSSITEINSNVFAGCPLKEVIIPDSIKGIYTGAFEGCSSLEHIKLGANLNIIQDAAFSNISSSAKFDFTSCEKKVSLSQSAMGILGENAEIIVPWYFYEKYIAAEDWKDYREYLTPCHNIKASDINGYIPITYYNGLPYEQRNMLSNYAYEQIGPDKLDVVGEGTEEGTKKITITELSAEIFEVINVSTGKEIDFICSYKEEEVNGESVVRVEYITVSENDLKYDESNFSSIKIKHRLFPIHFSTIENVKNFRDGNPDYRKTGVEAINGCTKSAVFDGRIFLTGNPDLPNTVFYSHRNLTGANDPTYFGAYNYFNDGDGNTPNVDLLSTPSMLMVLKNNTVQDGSIYYHVGAYNDDEYSKDFVPRIYPATTGVAGLGSAGTTVPGTTACNFLDDPVFLSTRGLEAVGKQTVNLERTLTHRSSNVDRLLIKEDLSKASLAEWKGYLVICCEGNFYLADSRILSQHADGSYQYEWYYLEGLGTYDNYKGGFRYVRNWYPIDESGKLLSKCKVFIGGAECELGKYCTLADANESFCGTDNDILAVSATRPDKSKFVFYVDKRYDPPLALETVDEERSPADGAIFYPATKIAVIGELLFFGTANGDVCVINTDKRGVPDYKGQQLEHDRISTKWYSFNGIAYPSICVTKLDDCTGKSLAKATVPGTTVARLKMMPGSRCRVEVSLNGRDFKKIGEAFASRYDAGDLRFDNFAFAENEDSLIVLRELTRNWVDKQYSFISEGFKEPFGLYELSYLYYVKGKIRRI